MSRDILAQSAEVLAIVDALRQAGRITRLYKDALVWPLDIEHPATKGILLAYVREAAGHVVTVEWSEPSKLLADARPDLTGEVWWVVDPRDDRALATEATESGALVAALRALRDGGA